MYTHTCIKVGCGETYQDADPDPYYCENCKNEKKAAAKYLDKKFVTTGQKPSSEYTVYENAPKVRGFIKGTL